MDPNIIINGLLFWIGLVALLTFHEFAHAWTSWKCGDDTARLDGRLTINPLAHIDPIGTVALPMLMIFLPVLMGSTGAEISSFIVGWAKPVPVNPANLRHPVRDDVLIALAGPAMNLVLGILLVAVARVVLMFGSLEATDVCLQMATLSFLLCFFNLIPVPPLDGSHVMRNFIGMSWETYWQMCRYGFIFVIIVIKIPGVQYALSTVMFSTLDFFMWCFRFPVF